MRRRSTLDARVRSTVSTKADDERGRRTRSTRNLGLTWKKQKRGGPRGATSSFPRRVTRKRDVRSEDERDEKDAGTIGDDGVGDARVGDEDVEGERRRGRRDEAGTTPTRRDAFDARRATRTARGGAWDLDGGMGVKG